MQAVCDILEQLVQEGVLRQYAIGGATAAGSHGEPLATRDIAFSSLSTLLLISYW